MLSRFVKYRPKPQFAWSIFSVSAVLFFLGLCLFIVTHSSKLVNSYKEEMELIVELKKEFSEKEVEQLEKHLRDHELVKPETVRFISKEDALVDLTKEMGQEILPEGLANPLFDAITFHMPGEQISKENISSLRGELSSKFSIIETIHFQDILVDQLFGNLDKVAFALLVLSSIFGLLAIVLIVGAIRVSLFDKRYLIRNMELVGASWSFIRRPFLQKSMRHAFISSSIAIIFLFGFIGLLYQKIPMIFEVMQLEDIALLALVLAGSSFFLYLTCTYFSVNKYLSMRI